MVYFSSFIPPSYPLNKSQSQSLARPQETLFKGSSDYAVAAAERNRLIRRAICQKYLTGGYADNRLIEALHSAIRNQRPLGKGYVQIAYPHPLDSSLVLKLDAAWIQSWIKNDSLLTVAFMNIICQRMQRFIDAERQQFQEFYDGFHGGKIIVPEQQIFMDVIDLPDDMLRELGAQQSAILELGALPIFYRVMPFIPELQDTDSRVSLLDLKAGYAEERPKGTPQLDIEDWIRANENWVTLSRNDEFDADLLEKVQYRGSLGKLLQRCREDSITRDAVQEFVLKAIRYSEKTGRILDLSGDQNILVLDDHIILSDALYPQSVRILKEAAQVLAQLANGKSPLLSVRDWQTYKADWQRMKDVNNALNYCRSINALAHALGMKERIRILETSALVPWEQLLGSMNSFWEIEYSRMKQIRNTPFPDDMRKFLIIP